MSEITPPPSTGAVTVIDPFGTTRRPAEITPPSTGAVTVIEFIRRGFRNLGLTRGARSVS